MENKERPKFGEHKKYRMNKAEKLRRELEDKKKEQERGAGAPPVAMFDRNQYTARGKQTNLL